MVASTAFTRLMVEEESKRENRLARLQKKLNRKPRTKKRKLPKPGREPVELLRSMPYHEYLRSVHWRKTRKKAVKRAGGRCSICNSDEPLNVHHLTYERLGREWMGDLQVLCFGCHQNIHEGEKPLCFDPMTSEFIEFARSL